VSSIGHTPWMVGWTMALASGLSDGAGSIRANPVVRYDPPADAVPRPTDPGADGPTDPALHQWPDILSSALGAWQPEDPAADPFTGQWDVQGGFFRFDLTFAGVVNPPGSLGCCGDPDFDPFRFGPNPVFGFIEFDVDADVDTGGEIDYPELRYTGNAARFGGLPQDARFKGRIALDAGAFDQDLTTPPLVERSGADFHIPLFGWEIDASAITRSDPTDWIFGPGETWLVPGYLFQRSHAFRRYSSGCCRSGAPLGSYEPYVVLRFHHDPDTDSTTLSLVYPLTNEASAAMRGESVTQWADPFFTNQNSVREALIELQVSTWLVPPADRQEPEFALLAGWAYKDPDTCLDPTQWEVAILVGGSYTAPQSGHLVVWSDVSPDVLVGDLQGNGTVDCVDRVLFQQWMTTNDNRPGVDGSAQNNRVQLLNFGPNFSPFDLNYNGWVDVGDRLVIVRQTDCRPGDFDGDQDVDQSDFGILQACFTDVGQPLSDRCVITDMDGDLEVGPDDLAMFMQCLSGDGVPSDPDCDED
jgi:hypothetical protein